MRRILPTVLLLCCLYTVGTVGGTSICQPTGQCSGMGGVYSCDECSDGNIGTGSQCPAETSSLCGATCTTTTPASPTYIFSNVHTATSRVMVSDHQALFSPSASCPTPTCSTSTPDARVSVGTLGDLGVDITGLFSASITVDCLYDSTTVSATVSIQVECQTNSTTLTASTFTTSQTAYLSTSSTPTFSFAPYTSTNPNCAVSTRASDTTSFAWSSHFVQSATGGTLQIASAEKYVRRSLSFYIVFEADGGATASVACTLQTKCNSNSISVPSFANQRVEVGTPSVYYQFAELAPTITDCTPTGYSVGSVSSSSATPTGINPALQQSGGTVKILPSDLTAKLTYTLYIWIQLPDAASSSHGPVDLEVGCSGYITPTIAQASGTLSQQTIGSLGSPNTFTFQIDDSNVNNQGVYKIHLVGFQSAKPTSCPLTVATYEVSTLAATRVAPVPSFSQVTGFSSGDSDYFVDLDTSALGTFSFFIWAKDDETRWDNWATSAQISFTVTCGSEAISTSVSSQAEVFSLAQVGAQINFGGSIAPLFSSSKPSCPVTSLSFYSDSGLSTGWSNPLVSLSGSGLSQIGSVDTTSPQSTTIFVKGTSASGQSASLPIEVIVCGNEKINEQSLNPLSIIADHTGSATFEAIAQNNLESLFQFDVSAGSHQDCLVGSFDLRDDASCLVPYSGSSLSVVSSPSCELRLSTMNPSLFSRAYLCLTSKGNVQQSKLIETEVCGFETPLLLPVSQPVTFEANQGEGEDSLLTIAKEDFQRFLKSSSENCPINYLLKSYIYRHQTFVDIIEPGVNLTSAMEIVVSTETAENKTFYVEGKSLSGSSAHLEIQVNILQSDDLQNYLNTAPFFESEPPPAEATQLLNQDSKTELSLPSVLDSQGNFCGVFIESPSLGRYFASNYSGLGKWKDLTEPKSSEFLTYSFKLNKLTLKIPSFISEPVASQNLSITLIDELEASSTTIIPLVISSEPSGSSGGDGKKSETRPSAEDKEDKLMAEIKSISELGELKIEFNKALKEDNFTTLSPENLLLYVDPEGGRVVKEGTLNLTWKAIAYEDEVLEIKIIWASPISISPAVVLDKMVVVFRNTTWFSPLQGRELEQNYAIQGKIPRQLEDTELTRAVKLTSTVVSLALQGGTWGAILFNTLLSGLLNMMLGMINSLQLLVHLPVFNVPFPPNAFMVFESLIPLVTFDVLEVFNDQIETFLRWIIPTYNEPEVDEVPQQFQNVGFEVFKLVPNMGTLGVLILGYLIKFIIFGLLKTLRLKPRFIYKKLEDELFFFEILLIFVEGYLDFCLISFLFLSWPNNDGIGLNWLILAFIMALSFIFIPGTIIWLAKQPINQFEDREFQKRWSVLFEDIRTQDLGSRLFYLAFVVRRFLFAGIAFSFADHPGLQLISLNLINLGILIYQGYFKPIRSRRRNLIESINEAIMCLASFHLMAFTDYVPDALARFHFGWSLVALVALHIVFNFGLILLTSIHSAFVKIQIWHKQQQIGQRSAAKSPLPQEASLSSLSSDDDGALAAFPDQSGLEESIKSTPKIQFLRRPVKKCSNDIGLVDQKPQSESLIKMTNKIPEPLIQKSKRRQGDLQQSTMRAQAAAEVTAIEPPTKGSRSEEVSRPPSSRLVQAKHKKKPVKKKKKKKTYRSYLKQETFGS